MDAFLFDVIITDFRSKNTAFFFLLYKSDYYSEPKQASLLYLFAEAGSKVYHIFLSKFLLAHLCLFLDPGSDWAWRCGPYCSRLHFLKKIIPFTYAFCLEAGILVSLGNTQGVWCLLNEIPYKLRWEFMVFGNKYCL